MGLQKVGHDLATEQQQENIQSQKKVPLISEDL